MCVQGIPIGESHGWLKIQFSQSHEARPRVKKERKKKILLRREEIPRFHASFQTWRTRRKRDNSVWWRGVENIRDRRVMCYVRGTRSDRGDEREDFSSFSPCNPWMSSELRVGSLQFVKSILEIWVQGGPETKKKIASSLREDGPLGTLFVWSLEANSFTEKKCERVEKRTLVIWLKNAPNQSECASNCSSPRQSVTQSRTQVTSKTPY